MRRLERIEYGLDHTVLRGVIGHHPVLHEQLQFPRELRLLEAGLPRVARARRLLLDGRGLDVGLPVERLSPVAARAGPAAMSVAAMSLSAVSVAAVSVAAVSAVPAMPAVDAVAVVAAAMPAVSTTPVSSVPAVPAVSVAAQVGEVLLVGGVARAGLRGEPGQLVSQVGLLLRERAGELPDIHRVVAALPRGARPGAAKGGAAPGPERRGARARLVVTLEGLQVVGRTCKRW